VRGRLHAQGASLSPCDTFRCRDGISAGAALPPECRERHSCAILRHYRPADAVRHAHDHAFGHAQASFPRK